jgi:hypothetical protein
MGSGHSDLLSKGVELLEDDPASAQGIGMGSTLETSRDLFRRSRTLRTKSARSSG